MDFGAGDRQYEELAEAEARLVGSPLCFELPSYVELLIEFTF